MEENPVEKHPNFGALEQLAPKFEDYSEYYHLSTHNCIQTLKSLTAKTSDTRYLNRVSYHQIYMDVFTRVVY